MARTRRNFSRNVLIRLLVLSAVALAALGVAGKFISEVYLSNQLTATGWVINGAIVGLFLLGMGRVVALLVRYMREESAVTRFAAVMEGDVYQSLEEIDPKSLIRTRHRQVESLGRRHAPINHGALAATMQANESTRISFPKFINNILILTGVFGTIVSLSIALVGASDLMATARDSGGMGMVIHGMSMALSTTITAILCYLFYGYFYLKLTDVQTRLLTDIEQITTLYLLPRHSHDRDSVLNEVSAVLKELKGLMHSMQETQHSHAQAAERLGNGVASMNDYLGPLAKRVESIPPLLREGFRLPGGEETQ